MKVVKDNLFTAPAVFQLISQSSGADDREMYQVFNMGTRLEIFTDESAADDLIQVARSMGVNARVIGRVEPSEVKTLEIVTASGKIVY